MYISRYLGFRWRCLADCLGLVLLGRGLRGVSWIRLHFGRKPGGQVLERQITDLLIGPHQLLIYSDPGCLTSALTIWGLATRFTTTCRKRSQGQSRQFIRPDLEFHQSFLTECLRQRYIGGIAADALSLGQSLRCGTRRFRLHVVEADMGVHKIADRLNA